MNGEMSYKQTIYGSLIERFAESGHAICEVEINDEILLQTQPNNIAARIQSAAKRYGKGHIRAISYSNKIYLINKLKGIKGVR